MPPKRLTGVSAGGAPIHAGRPRHTGSGTPTPWEVSKYASMRNPRGFSILAHGEQVWVFPEESSYLLTVSKYAFSSEFFHTSILAHFPGVWGR